MSVPKDIRKDFISLFAEESFDPLESSVSEDNLSIVYSHLEKNKARFKLTNMGVILITEPNDESVRKACGINLISGDVSDKYRQIVARHFNIDWRL